MSPNCSICDGACIEADLAPLATPNLAWLWEQLGVAADRRGDPRLAEGSLEIRAPAAAEHRAAAGGLLGDRLLRPGQSRRIDLAQLTLRLRVRGPHLTPGAVAAHALKRPLAVRSKAEAERTGLEQQLQSLFVNLMLAVPEHAPVRPDPARVWPVLRRTGWVARLLSDGAPATLVGATARAIAALPRNGARLDRRRLATDATGNPHALDEGGALGGFVLAVLVAAERVQGRQSPRAAWAAVGVDCDDVTGGLLSVGIFPIDWKVPLGQAVTLPPRVLGSCQWPPPPAPAWVFVTENPSVASAAADLTAEDVDVRLLCTSGTPSAREIAAIARLAAAGWHVAVRADFDEAGLAHVAAILGGVPGAVPWRMASRDYIASLEIAHDESMKLNPAKISETPWDASLSITMRQRGIPAFEETLLPVLLEDLRRGRPA